MFTIHKTRDGKFHVCKNGMNWSPYFSTEADAAMFLHRAKYNRGNDDVAYLMNDTSYRQAHGVAATLPVFAGRDVSVAQLVTNRINIVDRDDDLAVY